MAGIDTLREIQEAIIFKQLEKDEDVQKRWKDYLRITKGAKEVMPKDMWYRFNYLEGGGRGNEFKMDNINRFREPHMEIYKTRSRGGKATVQSTKPRR